MPLIQAIVRGIKATATADDAAQEGEKSRVYMQAIGMEPISDKAQDVPKSEPAEIPHSL